MIAWALRSGGCRARPPEALKPMRRLPCPPHRACPSPSRTVSWVVALSLAIAPMPGRAEDTATAPSDGTGRAKKAATAPPPVPRPRCNRAQFEKIATYARDELHLKGLKEEAVSFLQERVAVCPELSCTLVVALYGVSPAYPRRDQEILKHGADCVENPSAWVQPALLTDVLGALQSARARVSAAELKAAQKRLDAIEKRLADEAEQRRAEEEKQRRKTRRSIGWGFFGVGAVSLVGFGILAAVSESRPVDGGRCTSSDGTLNDPCYWNLRGAYIPGLAVGAVFMIGGGALVRLNKEQP